MKIVVIGHGMVGHKFLETLMGSGAPDLAVTVLCEEPRPAYDRVHLSEFFAGKSAEDLSLVPAGFFERGNVLLKLNVGNGALPAVLEIMPSLSSPTVTPLAGGEMHAVESVVAKHGVNTLIPAIKAAGGRDILEIPISKIVD